MFLTRTALSPVDEALFLGGLALGIPAVVPASFTLPYGSALRAAGPAAMVEAAMGLPNLRLRRRLRVPVDLPFSFDYSFVTEEVAGGDTLGGTPASSFVVVNEDKGDGIEVLGEAGPDVAIEIAVGDPRVDITMTDYLEEFAAKLPAVDSHGWERWKGAAPLHAPVKKGRCIDEAKGEFAGANAAVRRLTEGRTARVFLHSIFEHPHTACSCFQGVSFYIAEVDGIGLIDVAYKGRTPDDRNWDDIANGAAGKQSPGYAAFGREYLRSRKFLQGDGGWQRVVWMPRALKARFAPDKAWIATEADVSSLQELHEFLATNRAP